MKQDNIIKATITVLLVALVIAGVGYFMNERRGQENVRPDRASVFNASPQPQIERSITVTEEPVPEENRFANDSQALNYLKRCESRQVSLTECKTAIEGEGYSVTALAPRNVHEDGFAGFLVFPLQDGKTAIMDYNTKDPRQQSIFFGSFSRLQELAADDGMGEKFSRHVKSIERRID